jgi:hypothetical protein
MIRFACPRCQSILKVDDADFGRKGPCPRCGQRLQVPLPPRRALHRTVLGKLPPSIAPDQEESPLVESERREEDRGVPPRRRRRSSFLVWPIALGMILGILVALVVGILSWSDDGPVAQLFARLSSLEQPVDAACEPPLVGAGDHEQTADAGVEGFNWELTDLGGYLRRQGFHVAVVKPVRRDRFSGSVVLSKRSFTSAWEFLKAPRFAEDGAVIIKPRLDLTPLLAMDEKEHWHWGFFWVSATPGIVKDLRRVLPE